MKAERTMSDKINIAVTVIMLGILFLFLCLSFFCLGDKIKSEFFQNDAHSAEKHTTTINWAQEYPFKSEKKVLVSTSNIFDTIKTKLGVIENYLQENLYFKSVFVQAANYVEAGIDWETDCVTAYNPVFRLEDNYLVKMQTEVGDLTKSAESTIGIKEYCQKKDIDFIYINLPYKVSKYTDEEYDEKYTFANRAADELLIAFKEADVDYLDIRENLHAEGVEHHNFFFDTDHHWKQEAALVTAGYVVEYLNENYGYNMDSSVFNEESYNKQSYKTQFLGSLGKKWTIAKVKPDDFTLLYPKFETKLSLEIPSREIKEEGDFTICYDMLQMKKDYQSVNTYGAYLYGDNPVVKLRNLLTEDKHKVLIIKDSYVNAMAPFLALSFSQVDLLDLRYFNGSVEAYIEKEQPDIVLVAYNTESISGWIENWTYDFR